jgi:hypothetical protein
VSSRTRWIVLAVALASAVCLSIAVQGARWWHAANISVGPGGTLVCFGDTDCRSDDLAWLNGSELWRKAGLATMAGSLLCAIALVALAGSLAAKRTGALAAGATLTATLTAATSGVIFLVEFPGTGAGTASAGLGLYLWIAGVLAAGACATIVLRSKPQRGRGGGPGQ